MRTETHHFRKTQDDDVSAAAPLRAFPSSAIDPAFGGMSMRDAFAIAALPAVIAATSAGQHNPKGTGTLEDMMAQDAYRVADAMMVERERKP